MQFSKAMVFEAYSEYVNNFTLAFETSKKQARSKQAFAEFLKVRHCRVHVTVVNYMYNALVYGVYSNSALINLKSESDLRFCISLSFRFFQYNNRISMKSESELLGF